MSTPSDSASAPAVEEVPVVQSVKDIEPSKKVRFEEDGTGEVVATKAREPSRDTELVKDNEPANVKLDTGGEIGLENKKKKRSKRRSAASKRRGTGFEEFYCDPPMTPAEYAEEKEKIYAPDRPFVDRIEECIQRFRARRRMNNEQDYVFSRFLFLGGVDTSIRQFQGTRMLDSEALEDASKDDIRAMTANDMIPRTWDDEVDARFYNPNSPEHWDVDFSGVVAGFLSEHFVKLAGGSINQYLNGVTVILNFLKYVDAHEVCPEYIDDVRNAQRICEKARDEFPAIVKFLEKVPGDFNAAATAIFSPRDYSATGFDFDFEEQKELSPTDPARMTWGISLIVLFEPEVAKVYGQAGASVVSTVEKSYEVTNIQFTDSEAKAKYQTLNKHLKSKGQPTVKPCGLFTVRPTVILDGWENTMHQAIDPNDKEATKETVLVMEEDLLQHLRLGTKLTMTVCTMDTGLSFIKKITDVRSSYYVFLPQELMFGYKEPVLNDRPAPSVHNPNGAEEENDILDSIPMGDPEDWDQENTNLGGKEEVKENAKEEA